MGCSQGALAKLLVDPVLPFDASSEAYDFLYEDIAKQGTIIGGQGITGTRSKYANRTREGAYRIQGPLATYTCPADLDKWLPRILGGTEVADVFDVAESVPAFQVLISRVAGTFQYTSCYVDKAIWRCQAGPGDGDPEMVEQILMIESLAEDSTASWPGSPPSISTASNRTPYTCPEGVLTIGGTTYKFKEFVIMVDNHLEPRWVNSLVPTALCPQDRTVALRVKFPFTATDDAVLSGIYQNANRLTGVTASIAMTLTGVACSTTFTFTGLQWAQRSPSVQGKRDIPLVVDFVARKTGSASELVVTNDSAA